MQKLCGALLTFYLTLGLTVATRADEQADLKVLLDKAIKARGGEEKLAKYKAATWKAKGKFHGLGQPFDFGGEWATQPGMSRSVFEFELGGMKFKRIAVVNG